ncbi:MAG: hypothetical protein H7A36_02440 [Chlamydiales bacterium]|nr:hypothetical protein [Chlamydiales bacterium]
MAGAVPQVHNICSACNLPDATLTQASACQKCHQVAFHTNFRCQTNRRVHHFCAQSVDGSMTAQKARLFLQGLLENASAVGLRLPQDLQSRQPDKYLHIQYQSNGGIFFCYSELKTVSPDAVSPNYTMVQQKLAEHGANRNRVTVLVTPGTLTEQGMQLPSDGYPMSQAGVYLFDVTEWNALVANMNTADPQVK